jgi:hypothetical protein|tara:strand:- start:415 stop:642 length:228 start_codon:yes stop_codon:yes gene_type:complete
MSTAVRYETAWHHCYYQAPRWIQETVIEEPHGRHAKAIAHEAAILAESDTPTGDFSKVQVVTDGVGRVISGDFNE